MYVLVEDATAVRASAMGCLDDYVVSGAAASDGDDWVQTVVARGGDARCCAERVSAP